MVGAPTISLHSWKQLAQWSLEYSCLSEEPGKNDKARAQEIYLESFSKFCTFVERKYGHLVDLDGKVIEDAVEEAYQYPPPKDAMAEEARRATFFAAQSR